MSRRSAAVYAAVLGLFLAGCGGRGAPAQSHPAASIPVSAPVPPAGQDGPIPLSGAQRAELDKVAAAEPPATRQRLRYALAADGPGESLVVYAAAGPAQAKHGKTSVYSVYKILNRTDGATYDPEQNAVVAPIAIPKPSPSA